MNAAVAGSIIDVAEGEDGWLFLRRYENLEILRTQADLSGWQQNHLPLLAAQFADRHRRLAAQNIPYVVAIAPEKACIYPEYLPAGCQIATPTAAELLTAACVQAGINAVDLTAVLRSAKGAMDLYYRVDSHWTYYGAYLAYRAIIKAVQETIGVTAIGPTKVSYSEKEGFGDLGVHLTPERRGIVQQAEFAAGHVTSVIEAYDERERAFATHRCDEGAGKAVVVRDSYTTFLAPYLSRTFAETSYAAPPLAMFDDMIADLKPDIVIHECSERALLYGPDSLVDWPARSWRQIYLEVHEHPQHARLIRPLRQALCERRFEAAVDLARQLSNVSGGALDHNLAEALLMSGTYPDALDICLQIEARGGVDAFTSYLKAHAERALGRSEDSLGSLHAALELRPGHPRFLFVLGLWLAEAGDLANAAAAFEAAVDRAPFFAEGWRRLALVRAALGDDSAAVFAGQQAERLGRAA